VSRALAGAGSRGLASGLALLGAWALKAWYAGSDADELAWLLGPTAALVQAFTGVAFEPEPGMGYLSRERAFLIAPVCAGVNWLVVAFTTLALGFAPRRAGLPGQLGWLGMAGGLALATTLAVNAIRISAALAIGENGPPLGLDPDAAHRLLGVAVYLGALLALAGSVGRLRARPPGIAAGVVLPLTLYLGVTVVAPLLRGAGAEPAFWHHAAWVVGATGAAGLGAASFAALGRRRQRAPPSSVRYTAESPRSAAPPSPRYEGPCIVASTRGASAARRSKVASVRGV